MFIFIYWSFQLDFSFSTVCVLYSSILGSEYSFCGTEHYLKAASNGTSHLILLIETEMRKSKYSPSSRSLSSAPVLQASFEKKKYTEYSSLLYGFPIHTLIYTFKKRYREENLRFVNKEPSLTIDKFPLL